MFSNSFLIRKQCCPRSRLPPQVVLKQKRAGTFVSRAPNSGLRLSEHDPTVVAVSTQNKRAAFFGLPSDMLVAGELLEPNWRRSVPVMELSLQEKSFTATAIEDFLRVSIAKCRFEAGDGVLLVLPEIWTPHDTGSPAWNFSLPLFNHYCYILYRYPQLDAIAPSL